jgi:hypothetical protein
MVRLSLMYFVQKSFRQLEQNQTADNPVELNYLIVHLQEPLQIFLQVKSMKGMYVIFRNVTTSDITASTGVFWINDANGNKMQIHDQSGYFTKRAHKLREYNPPIEGTAIQYIRGVIGHYSNPKFICSQTNAA